MKVWSVVKSILDRAPLTVKFYIGFVLFGFLLIGSVSLHAYIKRPEQMQSLQLYEQKLEDISFKKVSEEYYASGRAYQDNNLKIIYDSITFDDIKRILSKENIEWNEINKNHIVGKDFKADVTIVLFNDIPSKKVILILERRNWFIMDGFLLEPFWSFGYYNIQSKTNEESWLNYYEFDK